MNLFAHFDELLNPEVVPKIALYVDEPVDKTRKAVQGLVYTIVGGLMKRVTSEIGVSQLAIQIQRGRYEGKLVANTSALFDDPSQINAVVTGGNEAISHLLPALKSSIAGMITTYAGMRNSSAISLLGLTTALVLDELGRQMRDQKLTADGLAASLFEQRDAFLNVVPDTLMPQLVEKLGLQSIVGGSGVAAKRTAPTGTAVRTTTPSATPAPFINQEPDSESSSLLKWGVGALLVVLLSGGYFIWQNSQNRPDAGQANNASPALPTDSINADTVARSLAVPSDTTKRPAAVVGPSRSATSGAANPLSAQLTTYLANPTAPKGQLFPLPTVAFQPGTVVLTPGSEGAITELASVLKTHPTTQIRLIGYANDAVGAGLTNKSLSFKRVNAIKQQLVNAGINYIRVDAIGMGSGVTPPKPGDSTAVRKKSMRKIDLRVVVK
ncbi:MAG: OmpA family protein [Bacteroidetes bacterium]|nr:OmpA family protein [Fibrella sp.]